MIEIIKNYITQIVYVAIFIAIIELVMPKTNLKKYIYTVVSLVLLCVLISPLLTKNTKNNISDNLQKVITTMNNSKDKNILNEKNNIDMEKVNYTNLLVTEEVKQKLEKSIFDTLQKNNIYLERLEADLDDKYNINEIVMYIQNLELSEVQKLRKINEILEIVKNEYGIETAKIKIIERGN